MRKYTLILMFVMLLFACSKEPDNPFDEVEEELTTTITNEVELDPTSIAGLHQQIFLPTCANSGCHDGTFEPDFRTIESSYNTLVEHESLKVDPSGSITKRVKTGNADQSMLIYRMTQNMPNSSGIMPLNVEPESDWEQNKETYINNVRTWINNGAKDMFGE